MPHSHRPRRLGFIADGRWPVTHGPWPVAVARRLDWGRVKVGVSGRWSTGGGDRPVRGRMGLSGNSLGTIDGRRLLATGRGSRVADGLVGIRGPYAHTPSR